MNIATTSGINQKLWRKLDICDGFYACIILASRL